MDAHDETRVQNKKDELKRRFTHCELEKQRSPRDEVIAILAEGLWTLMCRGRGPTSRCCNWRE
jgi:hypothetical protein